MDKEILRFFRKEKHKRILELFMILDEISKTEDIISFSYTDNILMVKTGTKDYYRVKIEKEV